MRLAAPSYASTMSVTETITVESVLRNELRRSHILMPQNRPELSMFCSCDHASLESRTQNHGDATTADLLSEVSRCLDKALWFLETHLQAQIQQEVH